MTSNNIQHKNSRNFVTLFFMLYQLWRYYSTYQAKGHKKVCQKMVSFFVFHFDCVYGKKAVTIDCRNGTFVTLPGGPSAVCIS